MKRRPVKSTKRSLGTVQSIEGSRESSSSIPLDELAKYADPNSDHNTANGDAS